MSRASALALAGLAALIAAVFSPVLFGGGTQVLGGADTDLALQFVQWRDLGFGELARGNLALWNPHTYSGAPFFGGMQSALLYPPNVLFLVLPVPVAMNWSIALNMWLLGAFMYAWALRRGLHPFAAFVAAALLIFCAPHYQRVYAGHVTAMAAMAWVPLIFLAIDEWLASRRAGWLLAGMLAVAMQVLAGHPQTVLFSGLMAGAYALFRLVALDTGRLGAAAGLLAIYAGGALLTAVQLFMGFHAAGETVRNQAMPFEFALYFSFPPENLLTLFAPAFFGSVAGHPYWGRWYLWEANAFIGVTGLALAVYGIAAAKTPAKKSLLGMAAAAALLAFGDNTPFFRVLYEWVPFVDRLRGSGKFMFMTALVLVLFAGCGLDRVLRERSVSRRAVWLAFGAAVALGAAGYALRLVDWRWVGDWIRRTGQTYLEHGLYSDALFMSASQGLASFGLILGAATLAACAVLLAWTRREPRAALALGILALAEMFAFGWINRPAFDSARIVIPELRDFLAQHPGDYRILNLARYPNTAITMRAYDAWGYDPAVTRRYAEFMTWSVGDDPARTIQYVTFRRFHPLLAMLRVKYVIVLDKDVMSIHAGGTPPLGRLELIDAYRVRSERDAILQAMGEASFDPRREVILEREPEPKPVPGAAGGRAVVLREGTDFLDIEVDVPKPSVLLITDAWTDAWRAVPLDPQDTRRYKLMPADYVLRAVPLAAGHHRLRVEYAPREYIVGAAVSIVALAAWLAAAGWLWRRRRRHA